MNDFFGYLLDGNRKYGKMTGVEYADVCWKHSGGGFQKEPKIQCDLAEYPVKQISLQERNAER